MSKNTSVNLSDHFAAMIDSLIASGRFGSASEVVREGLRLVETREAALARLRRAVAESEGSGEATPFDMAAWLEEQDWLDSAA
ncbi:MAG: antitoxin ParD1/3/4 [Sphingomonadales bacterium]|jgi:antitoxin ParD1/3/4|nr:antitoxin ParD1/3/4 [Sphingomonadales bacterium]